MKTAFVFDQSLCTGCEACRVGCGVENGGGRDLGWRKIHTFNPAHHPALPTQHLSLACNHCDRPACLLGCPAAAYRRDEKTGAVLLDSDKCVGCRYCSWVCPYDVPQFDEAAGVMTKCTFCAHRLVEGKAPACAQACPTGALSHTARPGNSVEPGLLGLPAVGLGPALVVRTPKRPAADSVGRAPRSSSGKRLVPLPSRKIRLESEWGLVLFTVVLPLLVSWFAAGLLEPRATPPALAILIPGGLALAVSSLHLGRPLRAWRAILNVRSSWLAREILFSSGFVATAGAALLAPAESSASPLLSAAALACGVGTLIAIDSLYRQVPALEPARPLDRFHSGEVWLTGLFLTGLIAGSAVLWLPAGLLKAALLIRNSRPFGPLEREVPRALVLTRAFLLVLACGAAVMEGSLGSSPGTAVLLAVAGEVLERCRFYLELEPVSPARLLALAATV